MTEKELHIIIKGCKDGNSASQRKLFKHMYNYGMSIASRYGYSLEESEDIANEGFYKVLKHITKYDDKVPFLAWVRKIIVNCAIDHFRKIKHLEKDIPNKNAVSNSGMAEMESEYLRQIINSLPPQYKMVFVLHTIEGYTHEEIAKQLNIKKGTSKSNLSKARLKLQEMVRMFNKNMNYVGK